MRLTQADLDIVYFECRRLGLYDLGAYLGPPELLCPELLRWFVYWSTTSWNQLVPMGLYTEGFVYW